MRLIKTHQSMLRSIAVIAAVIFTFTAGSACQVMGVINLVPLGTSNVPVVSGILAIGSLVAGIIEFN